MARYLGRESPLKHVYSSSRITHLQVILDDSVFPLQCPSSILRISVWESLDEYDRQNVESSMSQNSASKGIMRKQEVLKNWFYYLKKVDSWYSGRGSARKPNARNNSRMSSLIDNGPSVCSPLGETRNLIISQYITLKYEANLLSKAVDWFETKNGIFNFNVNVNE